MKRHILIMILIAFTITGCTGKNIESNENNQAVGTNNQNTKVLSTIEDIKDPSQHKEAEKQWGFGLSDIYINGNPVLSATYEQLAKAFGKPNSIKPIKARPPAVEDGVYEYFLVAVYDGMEIEFGPEDEERNELFNSDIAFRFDITGDEMEFDCGLKVGMIVDEVIKQFGERSIYTIEDVEEPIELSYIKAVLEGHKPNGYYAQYTKAMIITVDPEKVPDTIAMSLVLLIRDNKVDRIVFGYPTAG